MRSRRTRRSAHGNRLYNHPRLSFDWQTSKGYCYALKTLFDFFHGACNEPASSVLAKLPCPR